MKKLAILGRGKIGNYIVKNIDHSEFLEVDSFDINTGHDLSDIEVLKNIIHKYNGVLVCTPFSLNKRIATVCNDVGVDYFDLTESVEVSNYISTLKNATFVSQCGLAPGMISVIANNIASEFEKVRDIHIRVGALPQIVNNKLGYYRTWSTEGLINEYLHPCMTLKDGDIYWANPLVDQETIVLNGTEFEAANTSGGIGSLVNTYLGKAENVNYKTIRFPGHFHIMRVLREELGLQENFDTFVNIFNKHIPETNHDVVYILISVTGQLNGKFVVKQYKKVIKSTDTETAIQIATGSGVLSVIDSWNNGFLDGKKGLVKQEDLDYNTVFNSKYAGCYR